MKSTLLLILLLLLLDLATVSAQNPGDYRTAHGGDWTVAGTWQVFNAGSWGAAATPPDATSGQITIQNGDSVFLNSSLSIDEIVVQSGGILTLFNGGAAVTYTLNDGTGDDISNFGKVYLAGSSVVLSGAGTLHNQSGGILNLLFSPTLSVATTNDGEVDISNTVNINAATLTNNNTISWSGNSINMASGAVLVNNDSMAIQGTSTTLAGTGTFTNAGTGTIVLITGPTLQSTGGIAFSNSGIIKGAGTLNISNTAGNTGILEPGDHFTGTPGVITANSAFLNAGTPTYQIGVYSTGSSQIASTTTVNVTNATLTVTDDIGNPDAIGTTYSLVTGTAVTGPFATVNLPSSIGNLTYNAASITTDRIGTLPLAWGSFTAQKSGSQALLSWSTLQESNTDAFIIERSSNGVTFSAIGTVKAAGNSHTTKDYSFTDASPNQGYNYYRLQQSDLDGKKSYSTITVLGFGAKSAVFVQTSPNPVRDLLNITVQTDNVMISVTDMNGRNVKIMKLNRGFHQTGTADLVPGIYQLTFYQGMKKIGGQQLIKL